MDQPNSQLTLERPDIWLRAVTLATSVTGREYVHKAPLPDGAIYACGGGGYYTPRPPTQHEIIIRKIDEIDRRISDRQKSINSYEKGYCDFDLHAYESNIEKLKNQREQARRRDILTPDLDKTIAEYEIGLPAKQKEQKESNRVKIDDLKKQIDDLKKERAGLALAPVPVPDGAMEWLLHEVGHWVAATENERQYTNYGYEVVKTKGWGKDREWQAWAFEEIILAPFGPSRGFAPVEHRGGTAFDGPGWQPIPEQHLRYANAQLQAAGIQIEQWRALYREWVQWGTERRIYSPLNH